MSRILSICHTSDMHNSMRAFSFLEKTPNFDFIVDSGDAIKGSSTMFYGSEPMLKKMSDLNYCAMAMGNREFNYIAGVIKARQLQAGFPIISANVEDKTDKKLISKYTLAERSGIKIAFIGLTPIQYDETSWWAKIFSFLFYPNVPSVRNVLEIEEVKSADVRVLLSHAGLEEDKKMALNLEGIDLILGGHNHIALERPIIVNGIPICHTGAYGEFVGLIRIDLDRLGEIEFNLTAC